MTQTPERQGFPKPRRHDTRPAARNPETRAKGHAMPRSLASMGAPSHITALHPGYGTAIPETTGFPRHAARPVSGAPRAVP